MTAKRKLRQPLPDEVISDIDNWIDDVSPGDPPELRRAGAIGVAYFLIEEHVFGNEVTKYPFRLAVEIFDLAYDTVKQLSPAL